MILTVTINPSVDKTYILNRFEPNTINRSHKVMYNAGSKGINVARVVSLLGQESLALGFVGGANGDLLLRKLDEEGINHRLVHAENFETRLNAKIMDVRARSVTEINELGDPVSDADFEKLLEHYKAALPDCSVVVISGSILPEMKTRVYADLIKIAKTYGKPVFVDCGGDVLKESVKAAPYCIKPNIREFEEMVGVRGLSEEDIRARAGEIITKYGVQCVIVTLGTAGAIGVTAAERYKVIPPDVAVASTVGAGDAFLAGVCYAYVKGMDFTKQMVLGTSCASAKITKEGNDVPSHIELLGYANGCRVAEI